jgi:hypothetical protein
VELAEFAAAHFECGDALAAAIIDQQVEGVVLVVAFDRRELQRGLEQRVQDMEARLVGGEPGALLLHATEGSHRDRTVGLAIPGAAPVLELEQLLGCFVDEVFDAVLVGEPVAATHGVVEVQVETVVRLDHAGRAALGGAGVAAHRIDLGDKGDAQRRFGFGEGDGGTQTGATCTYDYHIGRYRFHRARPLGSVGIGAEVSTLWGSYG